MARHCVQAFGTAVMSVLQPPSVGAAWGSSESLCGRAVACGCPWYHMVLSVNRGLWGHCTSPFRQPQACDSSDPARHGCTQVPALPPNLNPTKTSTGGSSVLHPGSERFPVLAVSYYFIIFFYMLRFICLCCYHNNALRVLVFLVYNIPCFASDSPPAGGLPHVVCVMDIC